MSYRENFPELLHFFRGYFHNIWPELYPRLEVESRYRPVIDAYMQGEPPASINLASLELKQLIDFQLGEKELRRIVTRDLGANIYPPGIGMTYQEWLIDVHRILTEKVK